MLYIELSVGSWTSVQCEGIIVFDTVGAVIYRSAFFLCFYYFCEQVSGNRYPLTVIVLRESDPAMILSL